MWCRSTGRGHAWSCAWPVVGSPPWACCCSGGPCVVGTKRQCSHWLQASNSMLRYGTAYVDAGQQAYEQKYRDRVLTNLQRKAKAFGYQLVHGEDTGSAQAATTL